MRRQVTTTEVRCDLCGRDLESAHYVLRAGPLDFCRGCMTKGRPCESCGSLPTFPDPQATWAGNCLACWRLAMTLPRGKCGAVGACLTWMEGCREWHFCDQLASHPDAHHCPDCQANWGLR